MLQARRALLVLISVVALIAGFAPAAFARPGMAAATPTAAPATAVRASARANTAPAATGSQSLGYWLVAADGGVFSGGDAVFHGSTGGIALARPIVGIAATPTGHGYWAVASDGGIFAFGDAVFHGSTGGIHLNKPIVGIAATPSGNGYWLVASDGGIFAFGDAAFHGSTGGIQLNKPIVGIATTPSGHGYWLVASDGGIFAFGDAAFHGSTGGIHLNQPIVGIGTSPSGHGYRMVASDGGVFSFGDAPFYGSTGAIHLNSPIVGMAPTASGHGYWFVAADGGVFAYGDAGFFGSAGGSALTSPIVGMVATAPVPAPTKLAFTTQPGNSTGGLNFATQPVVTVEDASGAPATHDTSTVHLTVTTAAGATFGCDSNAAAAVEGVATFSGCAIDLAGSYTLTATDGTLTPAVSESLTVAVGAAAHLRISTQPLGAVHGVALTTQPIVRVEDAGNNLVTAGSSVVTLALTHPLTGTPVLTCTTALTRTTASGLATFAGCAVDTIGDYTLTATDPGLTSAVSTQFEITNAASQLAFTTQPSPAATGGAVFAVQPVVTVQDSTGHTIVADTRSITLTVTTGGAAVPCTTNPKAAVAGVATFAGCKINTAVSSTLTATGTFTVASNVVAVTVGAAAKLAFTTQPGDSTGGVAFTQPAVTVQDLGGNTVTTGTTVVHLAITGTPAAGVALTCTPTTNDITAVSGVATFVGCAINTANSYTLTATATGLTPAVSGAHPVITVGAAAKLAFTTQPGDSTGGVAFTQPVVAIQDLGGNTVTAAGASSVTLAITGTPAGVALTCTSANPLPHVNGVATFVGCAINTAGSYTLTATDGSLTAAVSVAHPVISVGAVTHLVFTTPPVGSTGGVNLATQPIVTQEDAGGNPVATANTITLSLTAAAGATLTCVPGTNAQSTVAGVATFAGCKIDLASSRSLTATATTGGFTVVSGAVVTAVGAAAKLAFTTQPGDSTGGVAFTQPVVAIQDLGGNTVTTATASSVTLAITGTPAAGVALTCTSANPLPHVSGVATFVGCAINTAGTYTLTATDGSLTAAVSVAHPVIAIGAASQLAFTTQPVGSTGGAVLGTEPQVTVEDAGGNTVTAANIITLTLTGGAGSLTCVPGTNAQSTAAGIAVFAGCKIDVAASRTLTATATTGGFVKVSNAVTTAVGAAAKLGFTTQPGDSTGGVAFTQPVVAIQDAGGNTVTTAAASSVTLAITGTPAAGTVLTCSSANPLPHVSGVATFVGCAINFAGSYTLTATDPGLTAATSVAHPVISVGTAVKLGFTTQPGDSTGGVAFTQPVVAIQDAGGNTVTTATASAVHLALTTAGSSTLTCTPGTNNITTVNGVAAFVGCSIDLQGSYTLTATDGGFTSAVSVAHPVIAVGPAFALKVLVAPVGAPAGVNFTTQPAIAIVDAGGNTVTTDLNGITLTNAGPGTGTLTCAANPRTAVAGVATFGACQFSTAGNYVLTASDVAEPGLGTINTGTITIT